MLKFLPLVALTALFTVAPSQASTLFLSTPATTFSVGQTFDVQVQINGVFDAPRSGDEVIGFGFDVTNSNAGAFQFLGFTIGPLFDDFSPLPNTDVFGLATLSITDPVVEPLLLATLHFQVLGAGLSNIGITSSLADLNEGLQYLSSADATVLLDGNIGITGTPGGEVPEPSTAFLLSLGLAGLVISRKGFRLS